MQCVLVILIPHYLLLLPLSSSQEAFSCFYIFLVDTLSLIMAAYMTICVCVKSFARAHLNPVVYHWGKKDSVASRSH